MPCKEYICCLHYEVFWLDIFVYFCEVKRLAVSGGLFCLLLFLHFLLHLPAQHCGSSYTFLVELCYCNHHGLCCLNFCLCNFFLYCLWIYHFTFFALEIMFASSGLLLLTPCNVICLTWSNTDGRFDCIFIVYVIRRVHLLHSHCISIKPHKLWCQSRVLLLPIPQAGEMPAFWLIHYLPSHPSVFWFQASLPPDNITLITLNPAIRKTDKNVIFRLVLVQLLLPL